jgi:hypothetical protein
MVQMKDECGVCEKGADVAVMADVCGEWIGWGAKKFIFAQRKSILANPTRLGHPLTSSTLRGSNGQRPTCRLNRITN